MTHPNSPNPGQPNPDQDVSAIVEAGATGARRVRRAEDPVSFLPGADDRSFQLGLGVVIASLVSALATYLIVMGMTPIIPRGPVVLTAMLINLALVGGLIAIITVQMRGLWQIGRAHV